MALLGPFAAAVLSFTYCRSHAELTFGSPPTRITGTSPVRSISRSLVWLTSNAFAACLMLTTSGSSKIDGVDGTVHELRTPGRGCTAVAPLVGDGAGPVADP